MALFGSVRGLFAREARTPSVAPKAPTSSRVRAPVPSEWVRLKEFVSACEAMRLDLCGLHASDCVGFFERCAHVEGAVHAGVSLERAARDHGFTDARHWQTVVAYFEARHSELAWDAEGVPRIRFVEQFRRAEAVVRERLREADARSLEPIHGVALERFAEVSAAIVRLGATPTRAALSSVLGELGIGPATYGAVRRGWLERIAHDSTRSLQRRYMDAFLAARQRFATLAPADEADEPEEASARARRSWSDEGVLVA